MFCLYFSNQSILTTHERDAGVVVQMFSREIVSILVQPSTVFRDFAGQDKRIPLRLENK